jgi:hypothetical protein
VQDANQLLLQEMVEQKQKALGSCDKSHVATQVYAHPSEASYLCDLPAPGGKRLLACFTRSER